MEETEYVVYMLAYDNAGNERKSNVIIVKTASKPITSDMYGKAVNYSANGVTSWKLFYSEVAGNFYLISTTTIPANKIPTAATGITATGTTTYWSTAPSYLEVTQELRDKFMFTWNKGQSNPNIKCVSRLLSISAWASFANGTSGNTNITESCAIGGPTIELFNKSSPSKPSSIDFFIPYPTPIPTF